VHYDGQLFDGWQPPIIVPSKLFLVELGDKIVSGSLPGVTVTLVMDSTVR
jgi:hypothetical protein